MTDLNAAYPIYLASSWRNRYYPSVLHALRLAGQQVYDFREAGAAFDWRDVDAEWENKPGTRMEYPLSRMLEMLNHPSAQRGYERDFAALDACEALILVAPCGRSAHLELGYAIGKGKPTAIYIPEPHEPELMYLMAERRIGTLFELLAWADALAITTHSEVSNQ